MSNLGSVLMEQGNLPEAELLFLEALQALEKENKTELKHPIVVALDDLSQVYAQTNRLPEVRTTRLRFQSQTGAETLGLGWGTQQGSRDEETAAHDVRHQRTRSSHCGGRD